MLNPPPRLTEEAVCDALAAWNLYPAELEYLPVGFGTHHWKMLDPATGRWLVNVDELAGRRLHGDEPLTAPLARLRAALSVPRTLRDHGYEFAVGPEPSLDGELLLMLGEELAVSVYRFLTGDSFTWSDGGWAAAQVVPAHTHAIVDILAALHTAPETARGSAFTDDLAVPVRDVVTQVLADDGLVGDHGPYSLRSGRLVAENAGLIQRLFTRYDELAAIGRSQASRFVLTHGEPHPGNTMRIGTDYVLIDWDTALIAPPERDLWGLEPEMIARHTELSGLKPDPALLDLYRLRWDLTEVCLYTAQLCRPHSDGENERASWANLVGTLESLKATDG
jgi:hypothetical protein